MTAKRALCGCLLMLAACAQSPGDTPQPTPQIDPPAPETEAEPVPEAPSEPETGSVDTVPTPPPLLDLVGQTPAFIQDRLGAPTLVRRDGPVQIMLYEGEACVLDITLVEPDPGAYFEATHVSARSPEGAASPVDACVRHFLLDPYGAAPDKTEDTPQDTAAG